MATVTAVGVAGALPSGATPRLSVITPRSVQRGHEHVLRFHGQRLSETQEVFLYSPGVEVLEITTVDAQSVDVRIAVAQDCRIGEHLAQLRTSRGISDFRSFYVGNMPHSNENEPNNSIRDCQKIEMNRSVLGTIDAEDVDVFEVTCSSGQRLNIEITAIRLGALFDSYICLLYTSPSPRDRG